MAGRANVVTVSAKLLGGRQMQRETVGVGKDLKALGTDAKASGDSATLGGRGWSVFGKEHDKARKSTEKHHSVIKKGLSSVTGGMGGMLAGVGVAEIVGKGISEYKSAITEVQAAQSMGIGGTATETNDILSAYKARGIGAQQLAVSVKTLAKATYLAQQQEEAHAKKPTGVLGSKAAALDTLKLGGGVLGGKSATAQLNMVNAALTKLPPGMEKTRLATELFGRAGTKMLPLLVKGPLGISAVTTMMQKMLPSLGKGKKGMEEQEVASMKFEAGMKGITMVIGMQLMPVITSLMNAGVKLMTQMREGKGIWGEVGSVIKNVVGFFKSSKTAVDALVIAVGGFALAAVAVKAYAFAADVAKVATAAWTGAQWLLNAALDANPIGIVIVAVAALAAGLIYAYKKVTWFREAVNDTFTFIKTYWPLLAGIILGPFVFAVIEVIKHWGALESFVTSVPAKLAAAGKGMWSWMVTSAIDAVNVVIGAWDSLKFKLPEVAGIGGGSIGVPQVGKLSYPHMAEGGVIRAAGGVMVGERGPEWLTLPDAAQVTPLNQMSSQSGVNGGHWRNATGDLIVSVQMDRKEVGRAVVKQFNAETAREA
jgi:hypothetical protein